MPRLTRSQGFSLIELLAVLAIIGIISGIAIPSFLGQRRRARVIGDAQSNARVLSMALETRKAEIGMYGASGTTVTWTGLGSSFACSDSTFLPTVSLKNATQMNYSVAVTGGGVGYTLTVTDPNQGGATVLTLNQSGGLTLDPTYNK